MRKINGSASEMIWSLQLYELCLQQTEWKCLRYDLQAIEGKLDHLKKMRGRSRKYRVYSREALAIFFFRETIKRGIFLCFLSQVKSSDE